MSDKVYRQSLMLLSSQLNAIQLLSTQTLTNAAQKNLRCSALSLSVCITSSCLDVGLLLDVISLPLLC